MPQSVPFSTTETQHCWSHPVSYLLALSTALKTKEDKFKPSQQITLLTSSLFMDIKAVDQSFTSGIYMYETHPWWKINSLQAPANKFFNRECMEDQKKKTVIKPAQVNRQCVV